MAIRLDFLIEDFFVKLSSQVFYRDSHTTQTFTKMLTLGLNTML